MRTIGIGHNSQDDATRRGRIRRWQQAKAGLKGPALSQTQLRMRMRRAEELGLSYRQYNALVLASGRDPRALVFTPGGMGLRLERRLRLPDVEREKLARLRNCHLLAIAPEAEAAQDFLEELRDVSALPFAGAIASPALDAGWGAVRAAFKPALTGLSLSGDALAMIGSANSHEPGWAAAIRAGFLPGEVFFERAA
ncbi:hypothetical protein N4R57_15700 [Rhodobacteraceae bacterium D3-12]|nr:hypothetical protein N4R57_15700 [Rhodobacteraceae bacterium D3-12]